jgi:hypothetical protein
MRQLCLILAGLAQTALGNYERGRERLSTAGEEMDRHTVIHDGIAASSSNPHSPNFGLRKKT